MCAVNLQDAAKPEGSGQYHNFLQHASKHCNTSNHVLPVLVELAMFNILEALSN